MRVGSYFVRPDRSVDVDPAIAQARVLKAIGRAGGEPDSTGVPLPQLAEATGLTPDDLARQLQGLGDKKMIEPDWRATNMARLTPWGFKAQFLAAS